MALLLALAGCATERPRVDEPVERHQVLAELGSGQLRMACETGCAASWRLARATLQGLHANQLWDELAVGVARIGYASDLAYYYLGRAAEGGGHPQAAARYYRLSQAATNRCDGLVFNSCDGIQLPAAAAAGLARVGAR